MVQLSELRRRKLEIDIGAPSRHHFHFLKFVTEGSGWHWVDFTKYRVARGDVIQLRPGQVHAFDTHSDHEALLLVFRPEAVSPDQLRRLAVNFVEQFPLEPHDLSSMVQLLEFIQQTDEVPEELRLSSMVPGILHAILAGLNELYLRRNEQAHTPAHNRASELVFRLETLVEQESKRLSFADCASRLHVTPRTLSRACHTVRGMTPKRLIDQQIAMEAKRRLVLGDETVEEIGFDLGFSEATNFVKFFKRLVETTPEAFRQAQRSS
ncbi:AraC family transcriptional regulator [Roseibacillus persicicus]|uniref:AraC family transcriptional regulator n=1 Tax=Roseibacillus persicicus TaxID=454148 RepID=UPI0028109142|nr:helix-turn-helix transcriptional regulator [Roseibacillus persicicus]MDQ8189796.1 helix-turn-helix transcriptional regulator [Roseibacillus persicicus]